MQNVADGQDTPYSSRRRPGEPMVWIDQLVPSRRPITTLKVPPLVAPPTAKHSLGGEHDTPSRWLVAQALLVATNCSVQPVALAPAGASAKTARAISTAARRTARRLEKAASATVGHIRHVTTSVVEPISVGARCARSSSSATRYRPRCSCLKVTVSRS